MKKHKDPIPGQNDCPEMQNHKPHSNDQSAVFLYPNELTTSVPHHAPLRFGKRAISEADRYRLVEGSKSPTREKINKIKQKVYKIKADLKVKNKPNDLLPAIACGPYADLRDREHKIIKTDLETCAVNRNVKGAGTSTVSEYREWCDTYRIRTAINGNMTPNPPAQSGDRISTMLSMSGARKIAESCEYMALQHEGFKTFVTGTFSQETRNKLKQLDDNGKPITTIQKEVTRTMDAMTKMYQRGWEHSGGIKVAGHKKCEARDKLRYCWVVEIPINEHGEENPHIHMLIDWRVEQKHFKAWANRIESIWGNGYFHLEKILDPEAAGAYMAKAAGYMTKANGQDDQGIVKGNRYAISSDARAPDWVTISVDEMGIMGRLIRETYDAMQHKYGDELQARRDLAAQKDNLTKRIKASDCKDEQQRLKKRRKTIGGKLIHIRKTIKERPIRATKYFIEIKSKEKYDHYIDRCKGVGWGAAQVPANNKYVSFKRMERKNEELDWIYANKINRGAWPQYLLMNKTDEWIEQRNMHYESANSGWDEYQESGLEFCQ